MNQAYFTTEEVIRAAGGVLIAGEREVKSVGVSTDSREIERGNLFVALKGERFDGNEFIGRALEQGAAIVVGSSRVMLEKAVPLLRKQGREGALILVEETTRAFQEIARFHRNRFQPRVVAITGSNGKSSTKEITAAVAGRAYRTLKNEGNLNNHIGLPMTLLCLTGEHEVVVAEMGMSGEGEITRLCEIASPDIGVVTNIAPAHLKNLVSLSNIRRAKGELIRALKQEGTAVLNADDPNVISLREDFGGRVISFGIETGADVTATAISPERDGYSFEIAAGEERATVSLPGPGYHNISNALAAAAAGLALDIKLKDSAAGIGLYRPLPMRMETGTIGGVTIINDTYNANPGSMTMAVKTLSGMDVSGKKILVMGDMLELGEISEELHRRVGETVAREAVDSFYAFGEQSGFAADEAIKRGMPANRVHHAGDYREGAFTLNRELEQGDCVLVKGSRGAHMETIIEELRKLRGGS